MNCWMSQSKCYLIGNSSSIPAVALKVPGNVHGRLHALRHWVCIAKLHATDTALCLFVLCSGRRPMIYLGGRDTGREGVVQHTSSSLSISTAGIRQSAATTSASAAAAAGPGQQGAPLQVAGVRQEARWSSADKANDEEDRALL
jgi:hypothetical protein